MNGSQEHWMPRRLNNDLIEAERLELELIGA